MTEPRSGTIYYKRSRFLTHLPEGHLYAPSHYWLLEVAPRTWRIGITKFSCRMLGDIVEFGFNVPPGSPVNVGQTIGWMEGFKAISDVYCVAEGQFRRQNPALDEDITLIDTSPYAGGWLYEVEGRPDPQAVDVHGYISILDGTIDRMLGSRYDQKECDE